MFMFVKVLQSLPSFVSRFKGNEPVAMAAPKL
jgi:hypothetical protein